MASYAVLSSSLRNPPKLDEALYVVGQKAVRVPPTRGTGCGNADRAAPSS